MFFVLLQQTETPLDELEQLLGALGVRGAPSIQLVGFHGAPRVGLILEGR